MPGTEPMTRRPSATRRRKPPSHKKAIITAIILVALLLISAICGAFALAAKTIPEGVSVCGVDVSNLSPEEAAAALTEPATTFLAGKSIQVTYEDHVTEIDVATQYIIDPQKTAQNAFEAGTKPLLFGLRYAAKDIQPVPLAVTPANNGDDLQTILFRFAREAEEGNSFFTVSEDYTSLTVDSSKPAVLIDVDKTMSMLQAQVEQGNFAPIVAATKTEITADDADLLFRRLQHDPIDATVEVVDNKPVIKPHQPGIQIDKGELERHLKQGDKTFTLAVVATMPEITTDMVKIDFFTDVLGEHTSSYNPGLVGRTKNVTLAANAINGVVLAPGATFSFNSVVGERSYSRGFMNATVYTAGGLEDGVGGGICQVSSTLYSAQLKADLQTVSRRNHTYTVAYIPNGQDATVSYGSIDYVFKNNMDTPVKITSSIGGGYLTVKILGTNPDPSKKVTIENYTISTAAYQTVTKVDESLQPGQTKVKNNGQNGATIDTYKVYWKDGVEQRREKIHRSVYSVLNKVVLVGPEASPEPSPELSPEPSPGESPMPEASEEPAPEPTDESSDVIPTTPPEQPSPIPEPSEIPTSDTGI